MKKIILASVLLLGAPAMMTTVSSCSMMRGANGNAIQTISEVANVAATAKEIANVLGGTLGLNGNQKSSLTSIFSNYIGGTNSIASLAGTNKASYAKQLLSLNKGTLGKLSTILTVEQDARLLGLGGKGATTSSLLNGLTGGSSLSGSAANVLSGLLLNKL